MLHKLSCRPAGAMHKFVAGEMRLARLQSPIFINVLHLGSRLRLMLSLLEVTSKGNANDGASGLGRARSSCGFCAPLLLLGVPDKAFPPPPEINASVITSVG